MAEREVPLRNDITLDQNPDIPLREAVYLTLRKQILSGGFKPGEHLTEIRLGKLLGTSRTPIREAIRKLEKEGLAVFHGFQKDPRPFYAMADCVVMPSYHEGMSNVNLEAAASGRPVITSDIPGCREAVEDGVTGILCRKRNTEDFALAMQEMLDRAPEEREAMGLAGRKKMEREFDRQAVIRATLNAIGL